MIDPFIASRVKRLSIQRSLMQGLLLSKKAEFDDPEIWTRLWTRVGKPPPAPPPLEISIKDYCDRPNDVVRLMAQAVSSMKNLRIFSLDCTKLSLYKETQLFLASCRSVYNPHLHKVVLHATFTEALSLLAGATLVGLEELDITFQSGPLVAPPSEVLSALSSALSTSAPNLRTLKIQSQVTNQDHSHFFKTLCPFEHLQHLSVQVQFEKTSFADISGLNEIIRKHSLTLQHLELLPERHVEGDEFQTSTLPIFLEQCLLDLDLNLWPLGLRSLSIPVTDIKTTVALLQAYADGITDLRLAYRYLTLPEVEEIFGHLRSRLRDLKHLSLDVGCAAPELLRFLACEIPGLKSLTLVIEDGLVSTLSVLYP
ncbi:hypothetical protein H0H87_008523 [Tephrocybe sp. NHM501043]|nr:hypothetical protein H0H87_008523 [Tephrocybe sp. NHM501043]